MKSARCKNWFSTATADDVGSTLAGYLTIHDCSEHDTVECKDARVELAAFILHCMKIEPREVPLVLARMKEHQPICNCGGGREDHK